MATKDTPAPSAGRPLVLVAGAASRDLATDDPRGWRLGGGVSYCALALARLGLRVRALVAVDPDGARAEELDLLRAAAVDLHLVPVRHGPVFDNIEGPRGRVQRCLSVSDRLAPDRLPAGWGRPDAMVLAPVAGELGDDWAGVARTARFTALGWQGLLRRLEPGAFVARAAPAPSPLVSAAELLVLSREDLDPAARLEDLLALVRPDATVVLTAGVQGGLVVGPERASGARARRRYPAIPAAGSLDATGAGDVFLAALAATRVDPGRLGRAGSGDGAIRFAAAAASLVTEGRGLLGVPSLEAVLDRSAGTD